MGKHKTKLAKGRLDKYYYMAKEHGYRSRAAFKLIQLNKKYNFLSTARNVIDLCAAPGSWLQVVTKYMPVNNRGVIIGVDLVPIKGIPNIVTFAEDITTPKCRAEIKKAMKGEKADVVLHDGAPNVGTEWHQDAFSQAELALAATKLATEHLAPGGWFITKVFRSGEYNKLLWVLYQLFTKVTATKPQASRSVSAEIFVVCQGFLAPKQIDPKLLDPRYVFKEVEQAAQPQNIFEADPRKHKRQRMGYEDGLSLVYKDCTVDDFVKAGDPISLLSTMSVITFKDPSGFSKRYEQHESTTEEIKSCFEDLKVLNKKDFKSLLKWRATMRDAFGDEIKEEIAEARRLRDAGSDSEDDEDEDESGAVVHIEEGDDDHEPGPLTPEQEEALKQKEMDDRLGELSKKQKKAVKKRRELDAKQRKRMAFQIDLLDEFDAPGSTQEMLFNLKQLKHPKALSTLSQNDKPDVMPEEDEKMVEDKPEDEIYVDGADGIDADDRYDDLIEKNLEEMYSHYVTKKKRRIAAMNEEANLKKKKKRSNKGQDEEAENSESEEEVDMTPAPGESLLMRDPDAPSAAQQTSMWFSQDVFSGILGDDDDAADQLELKKLLAARAKKQKLSETKSANTGKEEKKVRFDEDADHGDQSSDDESDDSEEQYTESPAPQYPDEEDEEDDSDEDDAFDDEDMDDEEKARMMALAKKMVTSSKGRSEIAKQVYNKFAYTDKPDLAWFVQDEEMHSQPNLPITAEEVAEMKAKLKEIDARSSKKVLEAKARKKKHMIKQLDKARQKAASVYENEDMSNKAKTQELQKIYSAAHRKAKLKKSYVIARKFRSGASHDGTRTRHVDSRLKKDKRALKAIARRNKKRKR